jgi:TPR repeat protein
MKRAISQLAFAVVGVLLSHAGQAAAFPGASNDVSSRNPAALASTQSVKKRIVHWNALAIKAYEDNKLTVAAPLFAKAARAGDLIAKYNLASMRIRDETRLVSQAQALAWISMAAQAGLAPAQFSNAMLFELGRNRRQDIVAANYWFEKAALQGHPEAALALATACFLGRGHALDYSKAALWYELAGIDVPHRFGGEN